MADYSALAGSGQVQACDEQAPSFSQGYLTAKVAIFKDEGLSDQIQRGVVEILSSKCRLVNYYKAWVAWLYHMLLHQVHA